MSMLTVRDLDPLVKAKLKERAAKRGRSMEAEARQILSDAVETEAESTDLISSILRHFGDAELTLEVLDRSTSAQRPVEFG